MFHAGWTEISAANENRLPKNPLMCGKISSNGISISVDLFDEGFLGGKDDFGAHKMMESNANGAIVNIAVEIENVIFDDGFDGVKGRRLRNSCHGVIPFVFGMNGDFRRIDADGGQHLIGNMDIGCGKTECSSAMGAVFDGAVKGVRDGKHVVDVVDLPCLNGIANSG